MNPLEIKKVGRGSIEVRWCNGETHQISAEKLRTNCPCAACAEARGDDSHARPIGRGSGLLKVVEHTREEELTLRQIRPVGNYAIGLDWGDGHSTGIYRFELLYLLGKGD